MWVPRKSPPSSQVECVWVGGRCQEGQHGCERGVKRGLSPTSLTGQAWGLRGCLDQQEGGGWGPCASTGPTPSTHRLHPHPPGSVRSCSSTIESTLLGNICLLPGGVRTGRPPGPGRAQLLWCLRAGTGPKPSYPTPICLYSSCCLT